MFRHYVDMDPLDPLSGPQRRNLQKGYLTHLTITDVSICSLLKKLQKHKASGSFRRREMKK
ncbi:hypothetical protein QT17_12925 [Thermus sp. 2.9]|uniref:hypothetical protein n=1 Tax=Thermus sp. (strain 2.9) TaxID=1577051 RepID=UPI000543451E|nr:hypothetical protein [Thermus sp. 2.9]KHG64334.1 hypothetical protein QT17_12925 [Thermus sp. 2.9]